MKMPSRIKILSSFAKCLIESKGRFNLLVSNAIRNAESYLERVKPTQRVGGMIQSDYDELRKNVYDTCFSAMSESKSFDEREVSIMADRVFDDLINKT